VVVDVFDDSSVNQEVVALVLQAVLVFLESSEFVLVVAEVDHEVELSPVHEVVVTLFVGNVVVVFLESVQLVLPMVSQTVVVEEFVFQTVVSLQLVVVDLSVIVLVFISSPQLVV